MPHRSRMVNVIVRNRGIAGAMPLRPSTGDNNSCDTWKPIAITIVDRGVGVVEKGVGGL
jgi:hypothetical protein